MFTVILFTQCKISQRPADRVFDSPDVTCAVFYHANAIGCDCPKHHNTKQSEYLSR